MGGNATTTGTTFQENVTAWLAVQVLAGPMRSTRLSLPQNATVENVVCESIGAVDDINCGLSNGGQLYFQCKSTIGLGANDAEIRKVFEQFARQFSINEHNRLFLAISQNASAKARDEFRELLEILRDKTGDTRRLTIEGLNESDTRLLAFVEAITDEAFRKIDSAPAGSDLRARFLSQVYVLPLDFGEGGSGTEDAVDRLSAIQKIGSRLFAADSAEKAWEALIVTARRFGPKRTGGDRSYFSGILADAGIAIRPEQRFDLAIDAVKVAAGDFARQVARHASINCNEIRIQVDRPLIRKILEEIKSGDLALAGPAGSGKSGQLSALASELVQRGHDVLVLPVDLIRGENLVDLAADFRLPSGFSLLDVLEAWTGEQAAYILIDALDAARTQNGLRTLCDLIKAVRTKAPRWRVIATIREFDLEKSRETQRLFQGQLIHANVHNRFPNLRVALVEQLTDDEIAQVQQRVAGLKEAFDASDAGNLRDLARNIFNLSLLVDLILGGMPSSSAGSIATQNQLLDRYWECRIVEPDAIDGLGREKALRSITNRMIESRRLVVDQILDDSALILDDIASKSVISLTKGRLPGDDARIAYSHNLLFDYGASRLWVNRLNPQIIDRFIDQQDLLLVIRPSLRMAFQRLWHHDPISFWERAIAWHSRQEMPPIGKIIAPEIASEEFRHLTDSFYLIERTEKDPNAQALMSAILHAALGRVHLHRPSFDVIGPDSAEWLALGRTLAERFHGQFTWELSNLLHTVLSEPDGLARMTSDQREAFGSIARNLLSSTIGKPSQLDVLDIAVWACARTAPFSDQSIAALRAVLRPEITETVGFRILPRLARDILPLSEVDEGFVLDLFATYLRTDASPNESTPIGGIVVPMRSNKQQDLRMFEYSLGESLPKLVKTHLGLAVQLMAYSVAKKASEVPRRDDIAELPSYEFTFRNRQCLYTPDGSAIWDADWKHASHQLWHKALAAVFDDTDLECATTEVIESFLELITAHASHAVLWKRLLLLGVRLPQHVGLRIVELLSAVPILREWETRNVAGQLITSLHKLLPKADRERIELAILAVARPDQGQEDRATMLAGASDSLVACLDRDSIAIATVRDRYDQLSCADELRQPRAPFRTSGASWVSEDEVYRMDGIDLDAEPNRSFRELQKSIESIRRHSGEPGIELLRKWHSVLKQFESRVSTAEADGISERLLEYAEGEIVDGFQKLAESPSLKDVPALLVDVKTTLLKASQSSEPTISDDDEIFDKETPYWGSPFPRIDAAQGLIQLISNGNSVDSDILAALESLAFDPVAAVRFQVVARLNVLIKAAPDVFQRIAERIANTEQRLAILNAFVDVLALIGPRHEKAQWASNLVYDIEQRLVNRQGRGIVMKAAVPIRLGRILHVNDAMAMSSVEKIADNPREASEELIVLLQSCEEIAREPFSTNCHTSGDVVRIVNQILIRSFRAAVEGVVTCSSEWMSGVPEEEARNAYQKFSVPISVIAGIACELVSNSNFPTGEPADDEIDRTLTLVNRHRLLIEALLETPLAEPAYEIMRLFRYLIPVVPKDALRWTTQLLRSAESSGLDRDAMVSATSVEIVECYLANHRPLLFQDADLRSNLVELLNRFVQQNWPRARELVGRLDEVFRG